MGCVQAVTGKRVCSEKIPDRIDSDKKQALLSTQYQRQLNQGN